ncbi:MAG TPA: penicillin-binding transpeptidase domain-containing protein [Solirubrobacterales bacterium]|jgi:peptidoglycan glycosyltransferase|nr:penicillin-binding transpeptidase domain-containing protein [Solirubrobacterales bacterium]
MNTPIIKLFGVVIVLYALLFGFTSYWSIFDAEGLENNVANKRPLLEEQQIDRGDILASDGSVIATSRPRGEGSDRVFIREYPEGGLFGNPIGYSFVERGRVGFELSHNDELVGNKTEFLSILDELRGQVQEGDHVQSSLDPEAQQTALDALGGQQGSVVAMVPSTGEIRAMVSVPTYDPNDVVNSRAFEALNEDENAPLFNRATQAGYQPGSTMKVVTATAALDSGEFEPSSTLDAGSPVEISGVPLENAGGQSFGEIDMETALTNSVNTYWAQVGEELGTDTMYKYMDRFGFNEQPPLDYPSFQIAPSGEFADGRLLGPGSDQIDVGRMAIGQDKLNVTPLQMAMVASAVANDGELMEPRLWSKVIDPDGREDELDPERQSRVMSEETANTLTEMMTDVVNEGTGGAAALAEDQVAGKTGTAEIDIPRSINQAWFIGFAPADDPQIAVAATVERTSGQGGTVAAPIAQQVLEVLLANGGENGDE